MAEIGKKQSDPNRVDPHAAFIGASVARAIRATGEKQRAFSAAVGLSRKNLQRIIEGRSCAPRTRARIEYALRLPFWTPAAEFSERLQVADALGFDPWSLTLPELRAKCLELRLDRVRLGGCIPRAYYLDRLFLHFHATHLSPRHANA